MTRFFLRRFRAILLLAAAPTLALALPANAQTGAQPAVAQAIPPTASADNALPTAENAPPLTERQIQMTVDGIERQARIYAPISAKTKPTSVVLVYHGHNGSAENAARDYRMQREWPEAITVYMQGLNTPGRFIDPQGKETGWQMKPSDQNDRDLKFFDAMLTRLQEEYQIDLQRIYTFGHSGGGYHVYLLWSARGEVLAAVAPMSSEAAENLPVLKPKPALLLAGKEDGAVKYEWVRKTMDGVRDLNNCSNQGTAWADHCTLFPSATGTPLIEYVHPGGHEIPSGAIPAIARFFRENIKQRGENAQSLSK